MKKSLKRYFGCHVSSAGGIHNAIAAADKLGINTMQIHPSPPQRWNSKPFAEGIEAAYLERKRDSGVEKVFFHGIYLINLANPDPQQFHLSKMSLVHYLDLCSRISADGVIFHVGSMKHQSDEKVGYQRAAEGINWIFEQAKNQSRLILEVAAGGGAIIGDRMQELAEIYDLVDDKSRVGFGLDTQHLWASGYNLQNDLESVVSEAEKVFSLEKIWAVHLNDSKTAHGSRRDRHENIGEGMIGAEALKAFFTHKKLQAIPFILETPNMKSPETTLAEVEKLRGFLKGAS